jgi:hypothetical protein
VVQLVEWDVRRWVGGGPMHASALKSGGSGAAQTTKYRQEGLCRIHARAPHMFWCKIALEPMILAGRSKRGNPRYRVHHSMPWTLL